jgi:hypothetical protein
MSKSRIYSSSTWDYLTMLGIDTAIYGASGLILHKVTHESYFRNVHFKDLISFAVADGITIFAYGNIVAIMPEVGDSALLNAFIVQMVATGGILTVINWMMGASTSQILGDLVKVAIVAGLKAGDMKYQWFAKKKKAEALVETGGAAKAEVKVETKQQTTPIVLLDKK